jgi:hypothetical protein
LGILYARAREEGLTAGGVAWVTIGAVEPVKELERGGRLGEDFGLISMMMMKTVERRSRLFPLRGLYLCNEKTLPDSH